MTKDESESQESLYLKNLSEDLSLLPSVWENQTYLIPKDGNIPNNRSGHTLSIMGSNIFLFGGLTYNTTGSKSRQYHPSNDLFVLRLKSSEGNNHHEWTKAQQLVSSEDEVPEARWNHTSTQINSTEILVFGGFTFHEDGGNLECRGDFWIFNAVTRKWRQVMLNDLRREINNPAKQRREQRNIKGLIGTYYHPPQDSDNLPCPRGSHTSSLVNDSLYIFGGYGGYGYSRQYQNDLYTINCSDNQNLKSKKVLTKGGQSPCPRAGHSASVLGNYIYIYGGQNDNFLDDQDLESLNHLYILDTVNLTWSRVVLSMEGPTNLNKDSPPRRWDHSAIPMNDDYILIFGGCTSERSGILQGATRDCVEESMLLLKIDLSEEVRCSTTKIRPSVSSSASSSFTLTKNNILRGETSSEERESAENVMSRSVTTKTKHKNIRSMQPRSNTDMVFFEKQSKIFIYGGLSNSKWLSDLLSLDVSTLIQDEDDEDYEDSDEYSGGDSSDHE